MPSTYSSLKIELIGTGDQAGTWGNTTNVNLGTAIEEAITGSANVTFASSNVAIALTDTNAAQVARNLKLNLVGTITNQQTLFIPAIEKQYLVVNNLSNAVVISNGTNASPTGTTVRIPAGRSMGVFNDSVNVAEIINYITEFQASNITVTSAINAVSANFTNTLTASNVTVTNNVNAAAVNVTGNVSASAVLVTNNVNAASLNLTNALTVPNGGTGLANLSLGSVLIGNNTGTATLVAPGASGNLLTSDGTRWISLAAGAATGNITIGNTTIALNGSTSSIGNLTLVNTTITSGNITATVINSSTQSANVTGYIGLPQNSQSAAYGLVFSDAGKHILHPTADTTARTFTIPANSNVPYSIGTAITFINQSGAGNVTIAITSDTMRLAGAGTTGSRTLTSNGIATCIKIASTEWIISGTNLT